MEKITINKWSKTDRLYIKNYEFTSNLSLDSIIEIIIEFINMEYNSYSSVGESYKRPRNKGEEQSDYVADMIGIGGDNSTHSHYSRNNKPIVITLPDGSKANGVVRIANHKGDLGTFAKNNPQIDFCISIVVGEKERINPDILVPSGRIIHIFEYILDKNFENKERILMNIADKIEKLLKEGWNKDSDVGIQTPPTDRTNGQILIKESDLRSIIQEEIRKFLENTDMVTFM